MLVLSFIAVPSRRLFNRRQPYVGIQRRGSIKIIDLVATKGEAPVQEKNIAMENPIRVVPAIMILVSGYPVLTAVN